MNNLIYHENKDIPCSEYRPLVLLAQSDKDDLNQLAIASDNCNKYEYVLASKGMEIINAVNNQCFDAVVLGLKFLDITGATVAYLIHDFDPLISLIFLSTYNNNILVSAAHDLNSKFWNKNEEFTDMPALCEKIYQAAIEMPCDNSDRMVKREYMRDRRELYRKYDKLSLPSSLAKVAQGR